MLKLLDTEIEFLKFIIFFKYFIYLFFERVREGERETSMCGSLACPLLGSLPAMQACALTGN